MNVPWRLLLGDVRATLASIPDNSVHCCVTSPPYWLQRSYIADDAPTKAEEIGLEKNPQDYVEKLVSVFEQVRRVLRHDGTLWLNLGDSYASGGKGGGGSFMERRKDGAAWNRKAAINGWRSPPPGLKDKDLVGIPWRVAFALQAAGWYLRQDIIWRKPNAAPEAVRDRPTREHEYLFLLSKRPHYFYDYLPVMEPVSGTARPRGKGTNPKTAPMGAGIKANDSFHAAVTGLVEKKNKRTVWSVRTGRSRSATHYATYPERLILPCILAGTSEIGVCAACGAPWERVVQRFKLIDGEIAFDSAYGANWGRTDGRRRVPIHKGIGHDRITTGMRTVAWQKTCRASCNSLDRIPATVLDPFAGSGTTLVTAIQNGRRALGCELNPKDVESAESWLSSLLWHLWHGENVVNA